MNVTPATIVFIQRLLNHLEQNEDEMAKFDNLEIQFYAGDTEQDVFLIRRKKWKI